MTQILSESLMVTCPLGNGGVPIRIWETHDLDVKQKTNGVTVTLLLKV